MVDYSSLLERSKMQLTKALTHLEISYKRIQDLPVGNFDQLDEETLLYWEGFSSRFARVSDIFLMKYLRSYIMLSDPGFNGSFRDFVNQGEKLGVIDDAEAWMRVRELRNVAAHEYALEDLSGLMEKLKNEYPRLMKIKKIIENETE